MDNTLVSEKHKLNTPTPWLILLEVNVPTIPPTTLYLVRNTEDIIFNSQTYIAFPFDIDVTKQVSKGEIPTVNLKVSNVSRTIQAYLEEYDGLIGQEINIRIVSKPETSLEYLEAVSWTYEVLGCKADVLWVTFSLGIPNPISKRFPLYRYIANHCNWTFNSPAVRASGSNAGIECGYTGSDTECKRTLTDCQEKNNSARFGGYIGMGSGGVRLA